MGRTQGTPGQRDRVYGRLGREHKSWVWKAEKDDLTFDILESRSRLDVPSGRNLSKILSDKSIIQKSSAGSWPAVLPPSIEELEMQRDFDLVRMSHQRLYGFPGEEEPNRSPFLLNGGSNTNESNEDTVSDINEMLASYQIQAPDEKQQIQIHSREGAAELEKGSQEHISEENNELIEDEEAKRFRQLVESVSEVKKLTFSMTPSSKKKFDPDETKWDNRHHISVSSKNSILHNLHRDFFDQPRGFDMCTKPRKALPQELITEKLMRTVNKDEIRIFPRNLPPPKSANKSSSSRKQTPGTRPVSRPTMSRDGEQSYHSDSYLQPYALSRRTSGNKLYVPASLSL